jgi:uncharacterized protein YebE (UPF0316 family)
MGNEIAEAVLIFFLRIIDVSLGTFRMILTVQGRRGWSALLGFLEVSIFITAIGTVIAGGFTLIKIIAYGLGFAAGTFSGITIDRFLGFGEVMVRVITSAPSEMKKALYENGHGVTLVPGEGGGGTAVGVIFTVVHRRNHQSLLRFIKDIDPMCIFSVQEIRMQYHGYFSPAWKKLGPIPRKGPVSIDL